MGSWYQAISGASLILFVLPTIALVIVDLFVPVSLSQ